MANAYTSVSSVGTVVTTAIDQVLEFGLRAQPLHRAIVDKRPVSLTSAGNVVQFGLYADLSPATTPLTETVSPDSVGMANPTTVTVTLNEYGNSELLTRKLQELSYSSVVMAAAEQISWNAIDTTDILVRDVARAGTNVIRSNAGAVNTGGSTGALTASDIYSAALARYVPVKLRVANSIPVKNGLYAAYIHPDASLDLRAQTGAATWNEPHAYNANSSLWAGEIGAFAGAFYVETPRAYEAQDGSGATFANRVARTLYFGQQGLVEAVAVEPHSVLGPVVDALERFQPIGWYMIAGWSIFRQASVWRVESGTSVA